MAALLAFHEVMGVLGVGDLHPGGAAATAFLLNHLAKEQPRSVLEVGAGIGLTTERMLSRGWHVVPLEPNHILRRELAARLHVHARPDDLQGFAADAGTFDAVIGESVFYGMQLAGALGRMHYLLRPHGLLALVEMVWTERADPDVAARVHDETRAAFGLPMVSRERLTWSDWRARLSKAGFEEVAERRLGGHDAPQGSAIRFASALRHPLAFAQHLRYRRLTQTARVPRDWVEGRMGVWRRS